RLTGRLIRQTGARRKNRRAPANFSAHRARRSVRSNAFAGSNGSQRLAFVPHMTATSRQKLGLGLGFAGVMLFGGTLPATRVAVATLDPLFLSAARASIAGCCGLLLLFALRRPWPTWTLWRDFALAGLCTIVGFPVFMALAMAHVPASHGGVVLGIIPLATVAAAALVTHERPSLGFWLASAA